MRKQLLGFGALLLSAITFPALAYDHMDYSRDLTKAITIINDGVDCHTTLAGAIDMSKLIPYVEKSRKDLKKATQYCVEWVKEHKYPLPCPKDTLYVTHMLSFSILNNSQLLDKETFNKLYCPPEDYIRRIFSGNFELPAQFFAFPDKK